MEVKIIAPVPLPTLSINMPAKKGVKILGKEYIE